MAKVFLKTMWFGPGGTRYRKSPPNGFTVIPDGVAHAVPRVLPKNAVILDNAAEAPKQEPQKPVALKEIDEVRSGVEASDRILASKTLETPAQRFARELAEEEALAAKDAASRDTKRGKR